MATMIEKQSLNTPGSAGGGFHQHQVNHHKQKANPPKAD
jgi:hypothetical protein